MDYYRILKDKWKSIESILGKADLRVKIYAVDGYKLEEIVISTESERYLNVFSKYNNVVVTEQILRNFDGVLVEHYTIHIKVGDVRGDTPDEFAQAFNEYFNNLVRIAKEKARPKIKKSNNEEEFKHQRLLGEHIPFDMDIYY